VKFSRLAAVKPLCECTCGGQVYFIKLDLFDQSEICMVWVMDGVGDWMVRVIDADVVL
jgi:hypothetical protein